MDSIFTNFLAMDSDLTSSSNLTKLSVTLIVTILSIILYAYIHSCRHRQPESNSAAAKHGKFVKFREDQLEKRLSKWNSKSSQLNEEMTLMYSPTITCHPKIYLDNPDEMSRNQSSNTMNGNPNWVNIIFRFIIHSREDDGFAKVKRIKQWFHLQDKVEDIFKFIDSLLKTPCQYKVMRTYPILELTLKLKLKSLQDIEMKNNSSLLIQRV